MEQSSKDMIGQFVQSLRPADRLRLRRMSSQQQSKMFEDWYMSRKVQ